MKQARSIAPETDDTRFRHLGIGLVVAIFGGLGLWAAIAPLSSAASAPGQVTVENYRKTVQHLEGGLVERIEVKDGDWVEKDQELVRLADTQPKAQLEVLWGQYLIGRAREARLIAQRDDLNQIVFQSELLEAKEDPRAADAMRVQIQTFQARKFALENEVKLYQEQVNQLKAKERGLVAQKASADHMVKSFEGEVNDYRKLLQEGYSEKQTIRDLERKYADSVGKSGEIQSSIAATAIQINEIQLKILQLKKDLQREVIKELGEVQGQLFELHEKIHALRTTVARCVIRAPEAGKVLGLKIHTIGGVIPPGQPILEIVPQNEKLLIEARLSPLDIDRVKVGQIAEVRFSAFKAKGLPKIEGKLVHISADIISEPGQPSNPQAGQQFYQARVEVSEKGLEDLARLHLELLPGMPAEVLIHTGQRTLFQYLADPLADSFSKSFIED
jgi:membrane fusion protein, epimerase transport system